MDVDAAIRRQGGWTGLCRRRPRPYRYWRATRRLKCNSTHPVLPASANFTGPRAILAQAMGYRGSAKQRIVRFVLVTYRCSWVTVSLLLSPWTLGRCEA